MSDIAQIGDIVCHTDEAHSSRFAVVIDFGPIDRWLRVRTPDERKRIWAKENVFVLDPEFADEVRRSLNLWPPKTVRQASE